MRIVSLAIDIFSLFALPFIILIDLFEGYALKKEYWTFKHRWERE